MSTSSPARLTRRLLLGVPALVAAAAAAVVTRPARASARPKVFECAADLLRGP